MDYLKRIAEILENGELRYSAEYKISPCFEKLILVLGADFLADITIPPSLLEEESSPLPLPPHPIIVKIDTIVNKMYFFIKLTSSDYLSISITTCLFCQLFFPFCYNFFHKFFIVFSLALEASNAVGYLILDRYTLPSLW